MMMTMTMMAKLNIFSDILGDKMGVYVSVLTPSIPARIWTFYLFKGEAAIYVCFYVEIYALIIHKYDRQRRKGSLPHTCTHHIHFPGIKRFSKTL